MVVDEVLMHLTTVALFGEAERGACGQGILCKRLDELADLFGNPPSGSLGLFFATQAILYEHALVFFRVEEEGFSRKDYFDGIKVLKGSPLIAEIGAIFAPGVGDSQIINAVIPLCMAHHQVLITTEKDLFDYLTSENS